MNLFSRVLYNGMTMSGMRNDSGDPSPACVLWTAMWPVTSGLPLRRCSRYLAALMSFNAFGKQLLFSFVGPLCQSSFHFLEDHILPRILCWIADFCCYQTIFICRDLLLFYANNVGHSHPTLLISAENDVTTPHMRRHCGSVSVTSLGFVWRHCWSVERSWVCDVWQYVYLVYYVHHVNSRTLVQLPSCQV